MTASYAAQSATTGFSFGEVIALITVVLATQAWIKGDISFKGIKSLMSDLLIVAGTWLKAEKEVTNTAAPFTAETIAKHVTAEFPPLGKPRKIANRRPFTYAAAAGKEVNRLPDPQKLKEGEPGTWTNPILASTITWVLDWADRKKIAVRGQCTSAEFRSGSYLFVRFDLEDGEPKPVCPGRLYFEGTLEVQQLWDSDSGHPRAADAEDAKNFYRRGCNKAWADMFTTLITTQRKNKISMEEAVEIVKSTNPFFNAASPVEEEDPAGTVYGNDGFRVELSVQTLADKAGELTLEVLPDDDIVKDWAAEAGC